MSPGSGHSNLGIDVRGFFKHHIVWSCLLCTGECVVLGPHLPGYNVRHHSLAARYMSQWFGSFPRCPSGRVVKAMPCYFLRKAIRHWVLPAQVRILSVTHFLFLQFRYFHLSEEKWSRNSRTHRLKNPVFESFFSSVIAFFPLCLTEE